MNPYISDQGIFVVYKIYGIQINNQNGVGEDISEIFKWFRGDFTREKESIRQFLNQYATTPLNANGRIDHIDYDWRLNDAQ